VVIATLAGQVQQYRLQRAHPAAGQMIDIGDHALHVVRAGDGVSVVFENGTGGMALDWSLVQPAIAEHAGTFAYDRAGMGWSEPGPRPRTIDVLVDELHRALQASSTPGPYVLVGHSFGGLLVRAYAYTYPDEVAGLVLVDAAHEDQFEIYPEAYLADGKRMIATMNRLRPVFQAVNASGIPALLGGPSADGIERLPADAAAARRAVGVMDSSQAVTTVDEMAVLEEDFDIVRSFRRPLGDIAVIVITRGETGTEMGIPAGSEDEVHAAWLQMQQDLLTISTDSTLVVAEGSGHNVHVERPELVIDAIRQVLDRVDITS
jgi:pimeloyl-ACP methyl ester carboxylesterase